MLITGWRDRILSRPKRRTVRMRLTFIYGSLFFLSGAIVLGITYFLVRQAVGSVFVTSSRTTRGVSIAVGGGGTPPVGGAATQTVTQSGGVVSGKKYTQAQLLAQARHFEVLANQQHQEVLHQFLVKSGVALGLTALISIVFGWIVAGKILRPLRTIAAKARDISETNLHERLAMKGPNDELKELGDTFDGLLERLERSFQSQRQFVANASHELRTPLARQQAIVQVALSDPDATVRTLRDAHERVLASGEQQNRLIEALLTLTRGHAGVEQTKPVELDVIAHDVLERRLDEADKRGVKVSAVLEPAVLMGDPQLLECMVINLVDNALLHNRAGGTAVIRTSTAGDEARLTIANTGQVVTDGQVERLFKPFQRLAPDRIGSEGLGLGLSIVEAIAHAHDGTVRAFPIPGGGLTVQVILRSGRIAESGQALVPELKQPLAV